MHEFWWKVGWRVANWKKFIWTLSSTMFLRGWWSLFPFEYQIVIMNHYYCIQMSVPLLLLMHVLCFILHCDECLGMFGDDDGVYYDIFYYFLSAIWCTLIFCRLNLQWYVCCWCSHMHIGIFNLYYWFSWSWCIAILLLQTPCFSIVNYVDRNNVLSQGEMNGILHWHN